MSKRNDLGLPRIDDSHHPFKRRGKIGPGPKRRAAVFVSGDWVCASRKPTKTHYVHACTFIGGGPSNGKVQVIKTKKARKKKYNKIYRAWRKKHEGSTKRRAGYRCHRTVKARCK